MAQKLTLSRRISTAARWPVGILLTSWRYMWRTTPMDRRELRGNRSADSPPSLPPATDLGALLRPEDGAGPLFHRRYQVRIRGAQSSPEELMARLTGDLNRFAPSEFASFQAVGEGDAMRVSREYVVRMPGPWDGPVRTVEMTPTSFRLATLEGHLEAGQIEFRAEQDEALVFTIESWARSSDRISNLLYDHLRMAKEIQLHMWTSFLERVVEASGGARSGRIDIDTRRIPDDARHRRALEELRLAKPNLDPSRRESYTRAHGWHIDDVRQPLAPEPPGPPLPDGSWEIARRLMRGYEFADPSIVRADYDTETPLEGRDMLLELRFLGLRFHAGVRVNEVYERTEEIDGHPVRVWGWSYLTLEGHLEQGEMAWEVRKRIDSGEVEFRVRAYSRRAEIRNPIIRLGFRIFGRREQLRFLRSTRERMRRLTDAALRSSPSGVAVYKVAEDATARPSAATADVHDQLARNVERD